MDILILGNGFDLAHGLNTRYVDFLDYCAKQYTDKITQSVLHKAFTGNLVSQDPNDESVKLSE
jgi:hypothetical protein